MTMKKDKRIKKNKTVMTSTESLEDELSDSDAE